MTFESLFRLYEKFGSEDYIGEPVNQTEHMIQAAMFAENDCCSADVVLACFFHDIGHLLAFESELEQMAGFGVMDHEKLGEKLLVDCGVPSPIPELVGNHIKAKRYNVYRNKNYEMSEASRKTFEFQGGPMNQSEALDFERDPLFEKSLQVRKYDELGKQKGLAIKPLTYYKQLLVKFMTEK